MTYQSFSLYSSPRILYRLQRKGRFRLNWKGRRPSLICVIHALSMVIGPGRGPSIVGKFSKIFTCVRVHWYLPRCTLRLSIGSFHSYPHRAQPILQSPHNFFAVLAFGQDEEISRSRGASNIWSRNTEEMESPWSLMWVGWISRRFLPGIVKKGCIVSPCFPCSRFFYSNIID